MLELDLSDKYDVVLCLCDGINYITDLADVDKLFSNIQSLMKEDALFIFDISSEHKLSNHLGNHTFAENYEEFSYIWENYFDVEERILEFDFTIFQRDGELFRKFHEYHVQRAHRVEELSYLLKKNNFGSIKVIMK